MKTKQKQVRFSRKQTPRWRVACRPSLEGALGVNACGKEGKEAGMGRGAVMQPPAPQPTAPGALKLSWSIGVVRSWHEGLEYIYLC